QDAPQRCLLGLVDEHSVVALQRISELSDSEASVHHRHPQQRMRLARVLEEVDRVHYCSVHVFLAPHETIPSRYATLGNRYGSCSTFAVVLTTLRERPHSSPSAAFGLATVSQR